MKLTGLKQLLRHPGRAYRTFRRLVRESRLDPKTQIAPYTPHGDPATANCAVFFCSSAQANYDIAWNYMPELRKQFPDMLFIASGEIKRHYDKAVPNDQFVYPIPETNGTFGSAKQALQIMNEHHCHVALMVALHGHVPRMDAAFRQLGVPTVVPDNLQQIGLSNTDKTHLQRWNRKQAPRIAASMVKGWIALDD